MRSFWTSFRSLKECEALDAMSMGFLSLDLEVLDALAQQLSSALLPGCNTTLNQIGTVPERQIEGPPTLNCEYSNFQYIKCKTPYFYSSLIRGPCCLSAFKLVAFCQAVLPRYCCCSTHSMHSCRAIQGSHHTVSRDLPLYWQNISKDLVSKCLVSVV